MMTSFAAVHLKRQPDGAVDREGVSLVDLTGEFLSPHGFSLL